MLYRLSEICTNKAIGGKIIGKDEQEFYMYAFQLTISQIIEVITCLLIGLIFHSLIGTVCYLMFFIPLRMFSGGAHAKNYNLCFLSSIIIFILSIFLSLTVAKHINMITVCALFFCCVVILWILAPMEDKNKKLSLDEVTKYKKTARIILLGEGILIALAWFLHINIYFIVFSLVGTITVAILVISSKLISSIKG